MGMGWDEMGGGLVWPLRERSAREIGEGVVVSAKAPSAVNIMQPSQGRGGGQLEILLAVLVCDRGRGAGTAGDWPMSIAISGTCLLRSFPIDRPETPPSRLCL